MTIQSRLQVELRPLLRLLLKSISSCIPYITYKVLLLAYRPKYDVLISPFSSLSYSNTHFLVILYFVSCIAHLKFVTIQKGWYLFNYLRKNWIRVRCQFLFYFVKDTQRNMNNTFNSYTVWSPLSFLVFIV